jgi:hypothetical protein
MADFLRAQAGWRLARAGSDPVRAARCAAALLDAAAYVAALRDDDRDLARLARSGCFRGQAFDPGPRGVSVARGWQYRDGGQAGPRALLAALLAAARAAPEAPAGGPPSRPGGSPQRGQPTERGQRLPEPGA